MHPAPHADAVPHPLDTAAQAMQELLRLLVAQMRSRGWEKADARLKLEPGKLYIMLDTGSATGFRSGRFLVSECAFCHGETFHEALAEAHRMIAGMDENPTAALAPWFDLRQAAEAR